MGFRKKKKSQKTQSPKIHFNNGEPSAEELISFLGKVMELRPIEFSGILKVLCVSLVEEKDGKKTARELDILLSEIIDQYVKIPTKQRKELHFLIESSLEGYREKE